MSRIAIDIGLALLSYGDLRKTRGNLKSKLTHTLSLIRQGVAPAANSEAAAAGVLGEPPCHGRRPHPCGDVVYGDAGDTRFAMGCGGSKPEEANGNRAAASSTGGRVTPGGPRVRTSGEDASVDDASKRSDKPERREGISSGKQTIGAAGTPASAQQQQASGPKSAADLEQLRKACASIMLFSSMTAPQQEDIFAAMFEVRCSDGDHIINQGDIGDVLYVVESGTFAAYLRQKGDDAPPVVTYTTGQLFGELALMYNCPRAATIRCEEPGRLFGLSRAAYEEIMRSTVELKMDTKSQFLRSVELLSVLSEAERSTLSDLLEEASYEKGETTWSAGETADCGAYCHIATTTQGHHLMCRACMLIPCACML